MFNYIRAEWYKVVHRRYFWVSLCLLLGLEGLFVLTLAMESLGGLQFSELVAIMCVTMMAGVYPASFVWTWWTPTRARGPP